jgi:cysteinyl-tRNA synthetase
MCLDGKSRCAPLTVARSRYDVLYVENVTDIDDKIILRSHTTRAEQVAAAVREPRSCVAGVARSSSR